MKCLNPSTIRKYIDNELTPSRRRKWDRHLQSCPSCRETIQRETQRTAAFKAKLTGLSPKTLPEKVFRKPVEPVRMRSTRPVSRPPFKYWAAAAAVTVGVLLSLFLLLQQPQNNDAGPDSPGPARVILTAAKLDGQPAEAVMFTDPDPEMTVFWITRQ